MNLYKQRIKSIGYGTVEFKDVAVKNVKRNVPMYFLFFASKHLKGLDFWKKITTKDESGQLKWIWVFFVKGTKVCGYERPISD